MTSVLNDALRTLRDPVARAEYFLDEKGAFWSKKAPVDELLKEVFELNMALEELREGDASVAPQLREAQGRFMAMQAQNDAALADAFARYDASKDEAILVEINTTLSRRRYIRNLIRDVENVLPN
jgi:molecular chaperone HscB